jgi:hypothetical protein
MLTARLFAGMASLLFVSAILAKLHSSPPVLLYLQLIIALVCLIFAAAYFTAAQWTRTSLNQTLGLLQFGFVCTSVGVFAFGFSATGATFVDRYLFPASVVSFLIACALFGANAVWAVVQLVRIQTK